jgi:hypothetical protein
MFRYKGGDATTSSWIPWEYGSTIPIAGTGDLPSINQGSPLLGLLDGSVKGNGGKYYQMADSSTYDISTEDIIFETVFKYSEDNNINPMLFSKSNEITFFSNLGTGVIRLKLNGAGGTVNINSNAIFINNTWYHVIIFVDKSGYAQIYVNGVSGSSVFNVSSVGSLTNAGKMTFFTFDDEPTNSAYECVDPVAYMAMWKKDAWLDTHLQPAIAAERFYKACGIWPQIALGTAAPSICTRNSVAYLNNNGTLYKVGANWPRVEHVIDRNGDEFKGYHAEEATINEAQYSEDLDSWDILARCTIDSANTSHPAPVEGKYFDGVISTDVSGTHAAQHLIEVSDNIFCTSVYVKAGAKNWVQLFMQETESGSPSAFFNLSNGTIGTTDACIPGIIDCGNGIYRIWVSNTTNYGDDPYPYITLYSAISDGYKVYVGDNVTVDTWWFGVQMELGSHPTSYVGPTITTPITRDKDELYYMASGNVGAQKGTIIADFLHRDFTPDDGYSNIITLSDGSLEDDVINIRIDGYEKLELYVKTESSEQVNTTGSTDICSDDGYNVRVQYEANSVQSSINGIPETTEDTSCTIPNDIDRINIAQNESGANQLNGWIKNVRIKKTPTTIK